MKHQTLVGLVKSLVLIGQTDRQIAANVALSILSNSEIQQQAGAWFRQIADEQSQPNDGSRDKGRLDAKSVLLPGVSPPLPYEVVSDHIATTAAGGNGRSIAPTSLNDDDSEMARLIDKIDTPRALVSSSPNRSNEANLVPSHSATSSSEPLAAPERSAGDNRPCIASSDNTRSVSALPLKRDGDGNIGFIAASDLGNWSIPSRPVSAHRVDALTKSRLRSAAAILFKVHDGRDVMDLEWRELSAYRVAASRESAILSRILNHTRPPADPTVKVREVISLKDLKRFMEEADKEERKRNAA